MEFLLEMFTSAPFVTQLNSCGKAHLLLLADFYNISVSCSARKAESKAELQTVLVELAVLPVEEMGISVRGAIGEAESAMAAADRATLPGIDPAQTNPAFL